LQAKKPCNSSRKSGKGMLPKNKLGAELFRNLNVVVGSEHKQGDKNQEQLTLTILSNGSYSQNR
jgi:large subunit ribosomal protein L13